MPLIVSPFLYFPQAATLPHNYKPMPSTLPPSFMAGLPTTRDGKPQFIDAPSGDRLHPDEVRATCLNLMAYVDDMKVKAEAELAAFERDIAERDLAERRRLAPGWLDSESKLLEPEKRSQPQTAGGTATGEPGGPSKTGDPAWAAQRGHQSRVSELSEMDTDAGRELDAAFSGMSLASQPQPAQGGNQRPQ